MRLIAHRGSSGHAPENTLAAFRLALEQKASAMEFDVHQTKDAALIVIHDSNLKRVNGSAARVRELTGEKIKGFDVGSWFDPLFKAERVPFLEEVLDLATDPVELHLELKDGSSRYPGIEERALKLIRQRRLLERVVISSFDHKALRRVRTLEKRARIGYLRGIVSMSRAWREMRELNAESLNISSSQANAKLVQEAHGLGLKVLVYTVNTIRDASRFKDWGVDGIFTNFPDMKIA